MTQIELDELTLEFEKTFIKLGITGEMYDSVISYLTKGGALKYCGTGDGCYGPCYKGQKCGRFFRGNCICRKED